MLPAFYVQTSGLSPFRLIMSSLLATKATTQQMLRAPLVGPRQGNNKVAFRDVVNAIQDLATTPRQASAANAVSDADEATLLSIYLSSNKTLLPPEVARIEQWLFGMARVHDFAWQSLARLRSL
jgi:hypothetical protein